jgi:hypothetical protein
MLVSARTLEEISELPEPNGYYVTRDLLNRIKLIMHNDFVLEVLVTDLPYKCFKLISTVLESSISDYKKILQEAVQTLNLTRNQLLHHIKNLSLHGEMRDINEMFQEKGITISYYNLDDFKRVDDDNVQHLIETWHFLHEKISVIDEDDDL